MAGLSAANQNLVLNSISQVRDIEDTFISNLATVERRLTSSFQKLLNEAGNIDVVDVALNRQQVQNILVDSGYFTEAQNLLDNGYQQVLEESFDQYRGLYPNETFQFAPASLQEISTLKQLDFGQFNQLGTKAGESLNRILTTVQLGDMSFNQAVDEFSSVATQLGNHTKTWINTGLQGIYSKANTMLAEDNGITEFQYVGPRDQLNRTFCKFPGEGGHLFEIKTKEEWDQLDNGQIGPVSVYRGGYNCRHQLVGIR
jgi:hypothetical protein